MKTRERKEVRPPFLSVCPCMGIDLVVKVHYEYSSEREFQIVSQEQGRCREAGSEGSWRQNCGPTDRNRI